MTKTLRKSDTSVLAIPLAFFMLMLMQSAAAQDPQREIEAAEHREAVLGDLKGAMENYQAILAHGAPKPIQARALLGLAGCQEKLGHREEARVAYTRLVKQAGDSAEAAEAREKLANWDGSFPGPRNLKFEQGVAGKAPPDWHVPGLPREADQWAQVRRQGCRGEGACAVMRTPENAAIRAGGLDQSFKAALYRGKTLRLTAWLRLEAGGAEDYAKMYLNVDSAMGGSCSIDRKNTAWTACEIVARVSGDASNIDFGFRSFGSASIWIDGVSFEVVSGETASGRP